MAHQLPKECYPPTDSDDESFVVLKSDSDSDEQAEEAVAQSIKAQMLPSEGIVDALEEVSESLMSAMTLQSLPTMPSMRMHESMSSSCTISTTLVLELQEKINELKQENSLLRSTLAQQNIVSRQHSDILTKWKEDVERVQDQHQQKFAKMKVYVEQLKKENKQLKQMLNSEALTASTESKRSLLESIDIPQQLKDLQDQHANDMLGKCKELENMQIQLDAANTKCKNSWVDLQQAKEELEALKQQENEQKPEKLSTDKEQQQTIEKLELEKIGLEKQNQELKEKHIEEIAKLKEDEKKQQEKIVTDKEVEHKEIIEKLELEKSGLEKQNQEMKEKHTEEITNIKQTFEMEISALKLQAAGNANQAQIELEQVLQKTKNDLESVNEQLSNSVEINEQQMLRINDLKVKLLDLSKVHDLKRQDYDSLKGSFEDVTKSLVTNGKEIMDLQAELQTAQHEIIALRASVGGKEYLAEQLNDYKMQVKANDEEYRRMEVENQTALKKEQQLQADNMVLKCQLMKMQSNESAEVQRLRIQLSELQNNILELKELKKSIEKEAIDNLNMVAEITKKYNEAKCDQDELVALGEQLKIYHHDFKTERESKQFVCDELNKVSADLQSVLQRNKELCEENEKLRLTHEFVHVPKQSSSQAHQPQDYPYSCPRCSFSFRNYRALEKHVYRCMELESLP